MAGVSKNDKETIVGGAFAGNRRVPPPVNEPVKSYAPGSPERAELKARLKSMAGERIEIPLRRERGPPVADLDHRSPRRPRAELGPSIVNDVHA